MTSRKPNREAWALGRGGFCLPGGEGWRPAGASAGRWGRRQTAGQAGPPGRVPGPLRLPRPRRFGPPPRPISAVWALADASPGGAPSSAQTFLQTAWPGASSPSEPGRPVRGASRLRRGSGNRQNPNPTHQPPPQVGPSSGDSANQPGSQMGDRKDLGELQALGPRRGGGRECSEWTPSLRGSWVKGHTFPTQIGRAHV